MCLFFFFTTECKDLLDQFSRTFSGGDNDVDMFRCRAVGRNIFLDNAAETQYGCKQVVEVMGNTPARVPIDSILLAWIICRSISRFFCSRFFGQSRR